MADMVILSLHLNRLLIPDICHVKTMLRRRVSVISRSSKNNYSYSETSCATSIVDDKLTMIVSRRVHSRRAFAVAMHRR